MDGFRGVLAYTLPEALWLAGAGTGGDILVAYPTADRGGARPAGRRSGGRRRDHRDGRLRRAPRHDREGRRQRTARPARSGSASTSTPSYVAAAAAGCGSARAAPPSAPRPTRPRWPPRSSARPGLRLAGLMAYEAQIAGVGDNPPGGRFTATPSGTCSAGPVRNWPCGARRSSPRSGRWRRWSSSTAAAPARSRRPTAEAAVTEIGAGLRAVPARAVRQLPRFLRPARGAVRAARGAQARAGRGHRARRRLPGVRRRPTPAGCRCRTCRPGCGWTREEGAGEVQTPLLGPAADELRIGDRVWFRHAKAGELCERFARTAPDRGRRRSPRPCRPTGAKGQTFA